jgi:acetyl esterase/lipase
MPDSHPNQGDLIMKRQGSTASHIQILVLIGAALLSSCQSEPPCGGVECIEGTYTYLTDGDCELQADVYSPPGGATTPAILWIHPGGMITGGRDWLDSNQLAMYLEAGYTVVAIDHRLAPEYRLETIVADVEAAYAWLVAEGPALFKIDPDRVAVVGHSAGGYLSLLMGYRAAPPPKALVAFYGYGDLTGDWAAQPSASYNQGEQITREDAERAVRRSRKSCVPMGSELEGRFDYYVYARQQGTWPLEISGHDPVAEAAWFSAYEPVQNATSGYPPTMLLHGRADTDVPFSAAKRMAAVLEEQGVAYEFVSRAGWKHVFDQMEAGSPDVQAALRQVLAFLDEHVK